MFSLFSTPPDPSILRVSRVERAEAIDRLITASRFRHGYYLLLMLSVIIVSVGLLENNAAVIIGGMILAPLLAPILLLSLSLVTRSLRGVFHASKVLLLSLCFVFLFSYAFTIIMAFAEEEILWIPSIISPAPYLIIAFCAGIAAAFAWVKEDLASSIAGVAISVSLLPPLCAVGIGSALGNYDLAVISLRLVALNFVGMLVAALLVFLLLGFFGEGKAEEKALEKEEGGKS